MSYKKARLLIVDDEPSVLDILSHRLGREGYRCTTSPGGEDALKKLARYRFHLVLCDIRMPGKSGMELLREMQVTYPDTGVIMVTAVADVQTAIKAMKMGAYDYIIKPFDLNMVVVSIDRALDKRRLILENRNYQLHLENEVEKQTEKVREGFLDAVKSLAYALEAKDEYTSGHSQRVTDVAVAIAQELCISEEDIERVRLAGLLHDIGKIGVRDSVLNKSGRLTDEEYQHIIAHCQLGEYILSPIIKDEEVLKMVRYHHERYDGNGYPDRLWGAPQSGSEGIPQGARILAVADAYDAMTSDRPYRRAVSPEAACAELERCKGTQFDPLVIDALVRVIKRRESPSVYDASLISSSNQTRVN